MTMENIIPEVAEHAFKVFYSGCLWAAHLMYAKGRKIEQVKNCNDVVVHDWLWYFSNSLVICYFAKPIRIHNVCVYKDLTFHKSHLGLCVSNLEFWVKNNNIKILVYDGLLLFNLAQITVRYFFYCIVLVFNMKSTRGMGCVHKCSTLN